MHLTPKQLAEEARRVLEANPMTPHEHFEFLVSRGIIDRNGRVLVARLFSAPDPDEAQEDQAASAPSTNGVAGQPAQTPTEASP